MDWVMVGNVADDDMPRIMATNDPEIVERVRYMLYERLMIPINPYQEKSSELILTGIECDEDV